MCLNNMYGTHARIYVFIVISQQRMHVKVVRVDVTCVFLPTRVTRVPVAVDSLVTRVRRHQTDVLTMYVNITLPVLAVQIITHVLVHQDIAESYVKFLQVLRIYYYQENCSGAFT